VLPANSMIKVRQTTQVLSRRHGVAGGGEDAAR
jgi:hypothetical protein